jgi:hypothetical protein
VTVNSELPHMSLVPSISRRNWETSQMSGNSQPCQVSAADYSNLSTRFILTSSFDKDKNFASFLAIKRFTLIITGSNKIGAISR